MPTRLVPLTEGVAPTIHLQRPVLLIGRHPDCDIRIEFPQISRRHCCIALAYDRYIIKDLGSTNGLRVNGRVVEEARLNPGDEIAIAQVLYRLEETMPTPEPAAAPAPSAKSTKPAPPGNAPVAGNGMRPLTLPNLGDDDDLIPIDDSIF
jgi:predicted component of type VI protein secretion system